MSYFYYCAQMNLSSLSMCSVHLRQIYYFPVNSSSECIAWKLVSVVTPAKCAAGVSCSCGSCCMGQKVSISTAANSEVTTLKDTEIKFPFKMKLFFTLQRLYTTVCKFCYHVYHTVVFLIFWQLCLPYCPFYIAFFHSSAVASTER